MKNLILFLLMCFAMSSIAQDTHTIDFETPGTGSDWEWIMDQNGTNPPLEFVSNPVSGGINTSATVAKFVAQQAGQPWALTYTDDDGQFTFDASNNIVKIMVYKEVSSPVAMKFEGLSPAAEILVTNSLTGQWEELTFDFSAFNGNTYSRLIIIPDFIARTQDNTIYLDNIQVPDGEPVGPLPEPTDAPPIPDHEPEDVLAIYTEVYNDLPGTNFNPFWGQSTIVTVDYPAAGNNTLKYENLNYQGTQLVSQDVSLFEYFHLDFWTPNSTELNFYLISPGPVEKAFTLTIEPETWVSVDIPLTDFSPPVNLEDVFQFKVDGNGTVYFDNWYFWKEPVSQGSDATLSDLKVNGETIPGFSPLVLNYTYELPYGSVIVPTVTATTNDPEASLAILPAVSLPGTTQINVIAEDGVTVLTYLVSFTIAGPEPATAPDPPTHPESDVLSFYSDAYTNVAGINFDPDWGQQTGVTLDYSIAGNNTLRYEDLDFQGTEFPVQDVSEYENFHLDFWTSNATELSFFLISQGPVQQGFELTIEPETWVSVDIDLTEFSPVDLTDVFQFMVTGNGDVWFDNWYFWRDPVNPQSDATLSDLMVDGETVPDFSSSTLDYDVELPFGTTEVPEVTATATYVGATVEINDAPGLPGTTEVVVTSEDETNTLTYSINFTVGPETPVSDYCYTEVTHFGGDPSSAIYLTIANLDANSMVVEIESADDDPVDLLLVNGGSGATISEPDTLTPGRISRTLSWADDPPADVTLNVLWSKESFGGNWQLSEGDITMPFAAECDFIGPPPVTFFPEDGDTLVPVTVNPALNFSTGVELADGSELTNADIPGILTFNEDDENGQAVAYSATINAEKTMITIVPDSDLAGEQIYYLALGDELIRLQDSILIPGESVTFTTDVAPKPYLALDVQDNFEDDGFATIDDWKFQDGPDLVDLTVIEEPGNPSNHVADYNRTGDFLYTNAQVILDHRMDLSERNEFELRVYFPSSNNYSGPLTDTAAIKLQNSLLGANAYLTQTEVLMPVNTYDAWQTIIFDFSAVADSVNYDQIVVQLGGENHLDPAQFYFDDLVLLEGGPRVDFSAEPLSGTAPLTVQFTAVANFGASSWQWDFDNDGTIDATVKNPEHIYTTPGTYTVKLYASNPFVGNDEEIKENYITVEAGSVQQYVNLPEGWSGISSHVVPDDASIETIFGPLADDIEIIVGDNGIYFPSQGINTLLDWDSQAGYMIKMLSDTGVMFTGSETASLTISLPAGWSIAPVTVDCEVNIEDLFAAIPQVMAVKEVAGGDVYWPEKGINTVQTLKPGHAYYIMATEAVEITYPECLDGYQLKWSDDFD